MEVRCGNCNKLFRVADEKITGKGIKFACTRCGSSVKITREDFENYTLSQTTVSALDLFTPKVKPTPPAIPETVGLPSESPAGIMAPAVAETPQAGPPVDRDLSPPGPDFLREQEEPAQPDVFSFEEQPAPQEPQLSPERELAPASVFEERQNEPASEAPSETQPDFSWEPEAKPEIGLKEEPSPELKRELEPLLAAEPEQKPEKQPEAAPALQPIPKPEPVVEQKAAAATFPDSAAKPISPTKHAAAPHAAPAAPDKTAARPATSASTVIGASPAAPSRSGQKIALVAAFVALVLAGGGAFLFLRTPAPIVKESPQVIATTEGLSIVNPAGALESNGDLLITGTVANATDRERPAWHIVVTVFDANGTVLRTIKLLNNRQLYTRGDLDILSKRGGNVQELMATAFQMPAVAIPPKGNAAFEARYFQPPAGISSFNAELQPADPARLLKEAAEEARQ
jgi:hypothetical protein